MGSTIKQAPTKKALVRRPRRRLFLIALLVVLIGFGLYTGGRHLWGEYHLRLAYKALESREFAEARGHFAEYLKVWPDNAEIHLLAARAARRAREYDEAGRLLSQYRKLGGSAEYAQLERAMAHSEQNGYRPIDIIDKGAGYGEIGDPVPVEVAHGERVGAGADREVLGILERAVPVAQ